LFWLIFADFLDVFVVGGISTNCILTEQKNSQKYRIFQKSAQIFMVKKSGFCQKNNSFIPKKNQQTSFQTNTLANSGHSHVVQWYVHQAEGRWFKPCHGRLFNEGISL